MKYFFLIPLFLLLSNFAFSQPGTTWGFMFEGKQPRMEIGDEVTTIDAINVKDLVVFERVDKNSIHMRLAKKEDKGQFTVYMVDLDGDKKKPIFIEQK